MIRLAGIEDAKSIAQVHVRSWQIAYVDIIPKDFLDALSIETRAANWKSVLADGRSVTALFELPSGIAGFVNVSASRDPQAGVHTGEIAAIYVDPSYWRQGIGKHLLGWGMNQATEHRWSNMTLWVLRDNRRARYFYEKAGWHDDGTERIERFLQSEVVEVRYAWSCTA
jgi:GNAT superfamily N-acetyltransferase